MDKPTILLLFASLLLSTSTLAQREFWGMTASNNNSQGVIFKTDSVGSNYLDVYTFNNTVDGLDPYGSLTLANDGMLYGMTRNGGMQDKGTIFRFDPNSNSYTKLHDFDSIAGQFPHGSLIQAANGKLYGMCFAGGGARAIDRGVIFEYDLSNSSFSLQVDFSMQNGANPYGSFTEGSDGILYAVSSRGGGDATGLLFGYVAANTSVLRKHSFIVGSSDGYDPRGSLIQGKDGHLYGFSRFGELGFQNGGGVLFKFDLTASVFNDFIILHQFDDKSPGQINGFEPASGLVQASNGKLYGMTTEGGSDSSGTLFEYDLTSNQWTKLYDFQTSTDGYKPQGGLMQASNGKLYGLTTSPGGQAKLFEYDIQNNSFQVKANVSGTPYYTSLVETGVPGIGIVEAVPLEKLQIFPIPATNHLEIEFPEDIELDRLSVYSSTGEQLSLHYTDGSLLDISTLPSGVYHLKVEAEGQLVIRKFVKL